MNRNNLALVGSDIELMPTSREVNGNYMTSSIGWWSTWLSLLDRLPPKGTRQNLGDGYWCHKDGLSAEYGFAPASTPEEFIFKVNEGRARLARVLEADIIGGLSPLNSFYVEPVFSLPAYESALELGCSPDYQAVRGGGGRPIPVVARKVPRKVREAQYRESGGHIHIALPESYITNPQLPDRGKLQMIGEFVHDLDAAIYPIAMYGSVMQNTWYRQRGVFRPTVYGVEYRSLGAEQLFGDSIEHVLTLVFDMQARVWEAAA